MNTFLFRTALFCSILVCIFWWTKISLNGYKIDFYFCIGTLFLNLICFLIFRNAEATRRKGFLSITIATIQIIGLIIFLWADTIQVDKVYEPRNNKYNLFASLGGWYKRTYFKKHKAELCADGQLWETKVPYYFPIIEIETGRDQCHKLINDSMYIMLYEHVPE